MRANNLPVNGTVVKEKAIGYAKELQTEGFMASNGWFERWKTRFNVSFKAIAGEEKSVTPEMTSSWLETYLPTILSRYDLKDIYNADEFGFFIRHFQPRQWSLKEKNVLEVRVDLFRVFSYLYNFFLKISKYNL